MSEEEIIKDLNKYISFANKNENFSNDNDFKWSVELSQRIKGLLDLYNKEKEERKRLGKLYYEANENCIKYEKNYISKDKIRDRIKFLDNTEEALKEDRIFRTHIHFKKEVLKELLEE